MSRCPIHEIVKHARAANVPFLVIGGFAVHAHGYVRTTDDLDLIVPGGQRARWSRMLDGLGMVVKNDAATFLQFDPKDEADMKVDLMFVSEKVFEQLNQSAVESTIQGAKVKVVSLLHLIALKCHSLQNSKALRRLKDMDDLIQLVLVNRLDLNDPELRATILRHGSAETYEKLRHACADE
jgi:Aminoglycoside-2''-adenylyltransferase